MIVVLHIRFSPTAQGSQCLVTELEHIFAAVREVAPPREADLDRNHVHRLGRRVRVGGRVARRCPPDSSGTGLRSFILPS